MTMGCLGANTQLGGQRGSYPVKLGIFTGISVTLPEIGGRGIPGFIKPAVKNESSRVVVYNPASLLRIHGSRKNPNVVPNNLAITGADIRSITNDIAMCDDSNLLSHLIFWAGTGEDTRKAVVKTAGQQKAPPMWISSINPLPELITVAAGANDALAVVIGGKGGVIVEKDAMSCHEGTPSEARNLSTYESFKNQYGLLIEKILDQYGGTGIKPSLIFITIPDVTAIPVTQTLDQGQNVHPFSESGFNATSHVGPFPVKLDKYFIKAKFDTGLLTECENGKCGRISLISRMKAAMGPPASLIPFLGYAKAKAALSGQLHDEDVLSPEETRKVSGRIREFQKAILEVVFTDEADPRLKELRDEGKVHVFDLNYLLYCLNNDRFLPAGTEPDNSYNIKSLLGELSSPLSEKDRASLMADADAVRAYFDDYLNKKKLRTIPQGGIVGPDYVHPTPSGHAVIAAGILALMKNAALRVPSDADPSFAGYSAKTLDALYAEALLAANDIIQGDKWVIPDRKKDRLQ